MSYYKVIDGVRYDRSLLDSAEALKGKGGQIDLPGLQQLIGHAYDGAGVTEIERTTVKYILDNYSFSEEATEWFRNKPPLILEDRRFLAIAYQLLEEYRIYDMELWADPRLIESMHRRFPDGIGFYEALRRAVEIILSDDSRNAPLYEVGIITDFVLGIQPDELKDASKWPVLVEALLKERMNAGYLQLLPVWEELPEEVAGDLPRPDNDVSSLQYWVFYLSIRTDDHQFWAIVDRSGEQEAFIYGYN